MKTRLVTTLFAVLLMLGLASCPDDTTVPRDFGGEPLKIVREDWEGVWREAHIPIELSFEVNDAAAGRITLVSSDKDKKIEPNGDALIHQAGVGGTPLAFMTMLNNAGAKWGSLNLVSLPTNGAFVIWELNHKVVEEAVKSGELSGKLMTVKDQGDEEAHTHAELSADKANYEKLMNAKFWNWSAPMIMVRAPKK